MHSRIKIAMLVAKNGLDPKRPCTIKNGKLVQRAKKSTEQLIEKTSREVIEVVETPVEVHAIEDNVSKATEAVVEDSAEETAAVEDSIPAETTSFQRKNTKNKNTKKKF